MSDREALLRSVLADPGDDTARLVFADWLEENGENDYAEFIRVQIELANPPKREPVGIATGGTVYGSGLKIIPGTILYRVPSRTELVRRELELWHKLPTAATFAPWSTGISTDPSLCKFWLGNRTGPECVVSRGFVTKVRCTLAGWVGGGCAMCGSRGAVEQTANTPESQLIWFQGRALYGTFVCPACKGSGHILPLGPAIVAVHPIEQVEILGTIGDVAGGHPVVYKDAVGPLWDFLPHRGERVSLEDAVSLGAIAWARLTRARREANRQSLTQFPPSAACGSPVAPRPRLPGSGHSGR